VSTRRWFFVLGFGPVFVAVITGASYLLGGADLVRRILVTLVLTLLALFLGAWGLLGFRLFSKAPSELEKLGADLAVWAWGIVTYLFVKRARGEEVLLGMVPDNLLPLVLFSIALAVLFMYAGCLEHSESIKRLYGGRLDKLSDLDDALKHPQAGRLLIRSAAVSFVAAAILTWLDLLPR